MTLSRITDVQRGDDEQAEPEQVRRRVEDVL